MRKTLLIFASVATLAVASSGAQAQMSERQTTGAVIGAGTGLVVAGPVGAVVGGVVGAAVGGPRITRGARKSCWYDRRGTRHCRWR